MQEEYYFVFFPKIIRQKQFPSLKKTKYLLSIYQGMVEKDKVILTSLGQDEIPPYTKQKSPKLSFTEGLQQSDLTNPTRLQIHKGSELIGIFHMRTFEYVQTMLNSRLYFFNEKAEITRYQSLQFQLLIGSTSDEINKIVLEYYSKQQTKSLFKQMTEINHQNNEFNFSKTEDINHSLFSSFNEKSMELNPRDYDEQQSVNSSIPNESFSYAFKINLQQVPSQPPPTLFHQSPKKFSLIEIENDCKLNQKDKILLLTYVLFSLVSIFISTIPIKKI